MRHTAAAIAVMLASTAAFAGAHGDRSARRQQPEITAPDSSPLGLPPFSVADLDTDRNGLISFEELLRADAPALMSLRGN